MTLANCSSCGKLFNRVARDVCPDCVRREEEQCREVLAYVRRHPGSSVYDVAEATNIPVDVILRFLRDGRLHRSGGDLRLVYPCQSCGESIEFGLYCTSCETRLKADLSRAAEARNQSRPDGREAGPSGYHIRSRLRDP